MSTLSCSHCSASIPINPAMPPQQTCPQCGKPLQAEPSPTGPGSSPVVSAGGSDYVAVECVDEANMDQSKTRLSIVLEHAKSGFSFLASKAASTAKIGAKRAERQKITSMTLPSAYHALGKDIYNNGRFREDFGPVFHQIDQLREQIVALRNQSPNTSPESMADKAKVTATKVTNAAKSKALSLKASQHLRELGKATWERHQENSGTSELIEPIKTALQKVNTLGQEIDDMAAATRTSKAPGIHPLFWIAIGAPTLLLGMCCMGVLIGGGGSSSRSSDSVGDSSGNGGSSSRSSDSVGDSSGNGVPNAASSKFNFASQTRLDFLREIGKMRRAGTAQGVVQENLHPPGTYTIVVNCDWEPFMEKFGTPHQGFGILFNSRYKPQQQYWSYLCSDGVITFSVVPFGFFREKGQVVTDRARRLLIHEEKLRL